MGNIPNAAASSDFEENLSWTGPLKVQIEVALLREEDQNATFAHEMRAHCQVKRAYREAKVISATTGD